MLPIPVGFDFLMVARFIAGLGVIAFIWWGVDLIGDQRELKVWNKINVAVEKVNTEAAKQGSLDEKIAAIAEAARQKALDEAKALPAIAPVCPANESQARALNAIR